MFILPPSMAELERRLRRRATDAPEAIDRRLATAKRELEHFAEYDYLVVNDNLETALKELSSIYVAARCTRARREHYGHALLARSRGRGTAGRRPRRNERRAGDLSPPVKAYDGAADTRSHRAQLRLRGRAPRRPAAPLGRSLRGAPGRRGAHHRRAAPRRALGLRRACCTTASRTPARPPRTSAELFGTEIAFLVEGVTKLGKIPWTTREERQAENFRKMLLAMARDIRVILIKLADRVDNMRTLDAHAAARSRSASRARRCEIYAPLANRLGIQWIKVELEDLAFQYLEPEDYAALIARLTRDREPRDGVHRTRSSTS